MARRRGRVRARRMAARTGDAGAPWWRQPQPAGSAALPVALSVAGAPDEVSVETCPEVLVPVVVVASPVVGSLPVVAPAGAGAIQM